MFGLKFKNKRIEEEIKTLEDKLEAPVDAKAEEPVTSVPFDKSRLVQMSRDPKCVNVYWEISEKKFKEMQEAGDSEGVIGLYPKNPEKRKYEFPVPVKTNYGNFYFNDVAPDTVYCAKFNVYSKQNLILSLRTESFRTFRDKPSDDTSETFSTQKELLQKL